MQGRLTCNDNTAAILASYIVQSELGDFYYQANDHDYLKSIKLLPNQTDELEDKIAEYHKALRFVTSGIDRGHIPRPFMIRCYRVCNVSYIKA